MEGDGLWHKHFGIPEHFNPLPPHGGRRIIDIDSDEEGKISIHSLRMEGDKHCTASQIAHKEFQSTPSAWRETFAFFTVTVPSSFQSTPSAWRETAAEYHLNDAQRDFNPLPPHGGRPVLNGYGQQQM